MKKFFILAAMMTATVAANAQYTPEAGKISTEVQFNPFGQSYNQFKIDGVKFRYFIAENQAVRLNLNFGLDKGSKGEAKKDDGKSKVTNSETTFGIGLGYEYHFAQNERISAYAGAGLSFETVSTKIKSEGYSEYEIKNLYEENGKYYANGYNEFGVKVFTGVDFYVYKGLYVGTELGFAFNNFKYKKGSVKVGDNSTDYDAQYKETTLGFYIEPSVRLGWTF